MGNVGRIAAFGAASVAAGVVTASAISLAKASCAVDVLPAYTVKSVWIDTDAMWGGDSIGGDNSSGADKFPLPMDSLYGFRNDAVGNELKVVYEASGANASGVNPCLLVGKVARMSLAGTSWSLGAENVGPVATTTGQVLTLTINADGRADSQNSIDSSYVVSLYGKINGTGSPCTASANDRQLVIKAYQDASAVAQIRESFDDYVECIVKEPSRWKAPLEPISVGCW